MKAILLITLSFFSSASFASSETVAAVEAFMKNKDVQDAVEDTLKNIRRVHGDSVRIEASKPSALFVRYTCGAKGCISYYLVSTLLVPQTVNRQGKIVAATVYKMGAHGPSLVSLLDRSRAARLSDLVLSRD